MTVLVLADEVDTCADRVVAELTRREVPVFRADTGWFPGSLALDVRLSRGAWSGVLRTAHRFVHLAELRSVWYRRPTVFSLAPGMSPPERRHAIWEAKFGLGGVLAALPVRWVNHPAREADASYKPHQLVVAARCGLAVPETMVTNEPEAALRFAAGFPGGVVTKTLGASAVFEDGSAKVVHTRRLTDEDLRDLSGVETTAHLFQEWVDKDYEARVTAVGDRLFAAAIHAGSEASKIDWRADFAALRYEVVDVPGEVSRGIRAYLAAFGLAYGAFDFAVTRDGRWVFFECNPAGLYDWIEAHTGLPISPALADLLEQA